MKIFFIGTVDFSYRVLSALIENGNEIVGVVTKQKSNFNADFVDLSPLSKKYKIPVFYHTTQNDGDIFKFIVDKNPDVIYCFGWSYLLSSAILKIPRYGVIGFHPAELPNNRGRHPIIWALFLGLTHTATSFFFMDEGADTGDIISQKKIEIYDHDNAATLYSKIVEQGIQQVIEFTGILEKNDGKIERFSQCISEGNYWRKRGKDDGKIDFRMSSGAIINLVRALTKPYIGAHIEYKESDVKIWRVQKEQCHNKNFEPGKVLDVVNSEIIVKTYDGAIKIIEHEFIEYPKIGDYL